MHVHFSAYDVSTYILIPPPYLAPGERCGPANLTNWVKTRDFHRSTDDVKTVGTHRDVVEGTVTIPQEGWYCSNFIACS